MMAKLIYSAISSLDGYVADAEGNFDWSMPDEEVHTFVNDLERPIGTYLFGRRMYEVMRYWETAPTGSAEPSAGQEYAKIWQAADKIVYSRSLEDIATARTRLEREFEAKPIQQLKAAEARIGRRVSPVPPPVVVAGGTQAFPDNVRLRLELLDERRFGNGVVHLHYRVKV
jgi:dihydrofolate reductase